MTRRLLLVAYYFPPQGGIASIRALSFARELTAHGWEVTVLAPRFGSYHRDPELAFSEGRVVHTASLELSRVGKRVLRAGGGDLQPVKVSGIRRLIRDAAHDHVYFPDAQVGWLVPALAAGLGLLRRTRFDAYLSSAWPVTAHLVARQLARLSPAPWVADFRDPWAERMPRGTAKARRAARLERRLVHQAAAVTMTSPSWAERHSRRWGRHVDVVLNGHDASDLSGCVPQPGVIGYLGTYYPGDQDLRAAWSAIASDNDLRLRVIGTLTRELEWELKSSGVASRTEETGFLPNAEAVRRTAASDILLLAGPADRASSFGGQIPAKVFEYLATNRPIVFIGDLKSDVADLLRDQPGCYLVATGDVDAAAAAFEVARGTHHRRETSHLSRAAQGRRLAQILDRAVDTTSRTC